MPLTWKVRSSILCPVLLAAAFHTAASAKCGSPLETPAPISPSAWHSSHQPGSVDTTIGELL